MLSIDKRPMRIKRYVSIGSHILELYAIMVGFSIWFAPNDSGLGWVVLAGWAILVGWIGLTYWVGLVEWVRVA